jgi:hypothetical protein
VGSQKQQRNHNTLNKGREKKPTKEKEASSNSLKTPQLDRVGKNNIIVGTRKLAPSPSMGSVVQNSDLEQIDEDEPEQAPANQLSMLRLAESELVLPALAEKHRALGNKKSSVIVNPTTKLLGENDSQNSNSQGDLLKNLIPAKVSKDLHNRALSNPRVISKVRVGPVINQL